MCRPTPKRLAPAARPAVTAVAAALLTLLPALAPNTADALLITELMAINDSTTDVDEDGEASDWLEIYNDGGAPVDLLGYYLTDNAGSLTKWQLPSVVLAAGGYLRVWASGKNRSNPAAPLHTNFRLSGDGEYLAIVQPDMTTIDHEYAPEYPAQVADVSYGLALDFINERCFLDPTPGSQNDDSQGCGGIEALVFSAERGFYETAQSVAITTATPGATIHYTLDGTTPSDTVGTEYTGAPISITTTTPLRAMAFGSGLTSTPVVTHTYIYLEDVIRQNQADLVPPYPDKWSGGTHADYDMDPEVVDDPAYASTIIGDLLSVPTMSIVTDIDHFFGPKNGIYTHITAKGPEWERPISMEIIYPSGRQGVQENAGIRIQGEYSRSASNKKHSMRVSFKNEYGPAVLDWPLFPDSPIDTVDQFVLTGGHGNSWNSGWATAQYIRDTWHKDTQIAMGHLAPHGAYLHLYINGIYWGLYRATERPNSGFMAEHLGGDKDDYDAINAGKAVDGDLVAWRTAQDLANAGVHTQAAYDAIQQYVDVDSLIDFMMVNQYSINTDWDFKNWRAARKRAPGAQFLFFSWDAEQTMKSPFGSRVGMSNANAPSSIYTDLRHDNAEFRLRFGDHVHAHFFNGGELTAEGATKTWMRRANEIHRAIVGESARWGDNRRKQPYTRNIDWLREQYRLRLSYFSQRAKVAVDHYRRHGLYPEVAAPSFNQHGGDFDPGFELTISAPAGTVYYTDDGSDPRLTGGAVAPSAQAYTGPVTLTRTRTVKARALVGSEWSAVNEARFMVESPIRVTEIMHNPPGGGETEFIEVQNIGTSAVNLSGYAFTDGIEFTFGATILSPGDHAIVVRDPAAFDAHYGAGLPVAGTYNGKLSSNGERIVLADSDSPASVILDFTYNDQWEYTTDGLGYSLVVVDPDQERALWDSASGWRASTFVGGSPGAAEQPRCSDGIDNDGDGDIDAGADDGCADANDDIEDPECDDGIDNDLDGLVDQADFDCTNGADDEENPVRVDSFHCYSVRESSDGVDFESQQVSLTDVFEGNGAYEANRPRALCLAAELNGAGILDETVHLQSYDIRAAPGSPAPVEVFGIGAENVLSPIGIDKSKPSRLMVASAFDPGSPPSAPDHGSHFVDHYKCYRMSVSKAFPRYFPSRAVATIRDALEDREYRLKPPKRFCAPVDVGGAGVKNPDGYLVCYGTRKNKYDLKHVPAVGLHTADLFGLGLIDTRKEEEVCIPTILPGGP